MNRGDSQGRLIAGFVVFTIQDRVVIIIPQGSGIRGFKQSLGFKPLVAGCHRY